MDKKITIPKIYFQLVKTIISLHPEFKKPLNKTQFSDFVIAKVIGDFMTDEKITDVHELKKQKAHDIYRNTMNAWEELYGTNRTDPGTRKDLPGTSQSVSAEER